MKIMPPLKTLIEKLGTLNKRKNLPPSPIMAKMKAKGTILTPIE